MYVVTPEKDCLWFQPRFLEADTLSSFVILVILLGNKIGFRYWLFNHIFSYQDKTKNKKSNYLYQKSDILSDLVIQKPNLDLILLWSLASLSSYLYNSTFDKPFEVYRHGPSSYWSERFSPNSVCLDLREFDNNSFRMKAYLRDNNLNRLSEGRRTAHHHIVRAWEVNWWEIRNCLNWSPRIVSQLGQLQTS